MIAFLGSARENIFSANLTALGMTQVLSGSRVTIIENHSRGYYAGRNLIKEYLYSLEYHNVFGYKERGMPALPGGCRLVDAWNQKLFYIAQETYANPFIFEKEFERFYPFIEELERYCEAMYMGVEDDVRTTQMCLRKASVIVVNVRQCEEEIEHYLNRYPQYVDKMLFLIFGYDKEGYLNRDRINRCYGLARKQVSVLPQDKEYIKYAEMGDVKGFMLKYWNCGSRTEHYPFINGLRDARKRIERILEEREGRRFYA